MYRYSYNKSVQLFFVSPLTLTLEFRIRIRIPNYKKTRIWPTNLALGCLPVWSVWISVEEGRTAGGLNSVNRTPQEGGGRPEAGRQGGGGMVGGDDGGRRGGGGSGQGSHGAKEDLMPHQGWTQSRATRAAGHLKCSKKTLKIKNSTIKPCS